MRSLINALSAHMIHINLNMIFYTHVKHSPTKTIYIKYYLKINKKINNKNALQTHYNKTFIKHVDEVWSIKTFMKHRQ